MSDIREEIKSLLNLDASASDEELIKVLGDEIKKYHPTGSEGEELRKQKTERFTIVHDLFKKFKDVLDKEKKKATALVPFEAQALEIAHEMDQIQSIYEIANLKDRVRHLENTGEIDNDKIRRLEKENKQLIDQIAQLREESSEREKKRLIELYKQSTKTRTWGFLSLAAGLVTAIPACSKFLSEVLGEVSSTIITILFFVIALTVLADWIYCKIRSNVVNDIACQFMDGTYLNEHLELKKVKSYGTNYNYYVSEQDLRAQIREILNGKIRIILFYFDKNVAVEYIKNLVVTHFLEFGQFKDHETQVFDTWFRIKLSDKDSSEVVSEFLKDFDD